MSAQVAADLRAAADVLRRDGWTQGTYVDAGGRHCAHGAIGSVCRDRVGAAMSAARALADRIGDTAISVWNDKENRTADEVIAAMLSAADAAEANQ